MSMKERARSVALSPGCRRCLSCEALYDLAFEEQHAPEAAADLMCSWAADSSKLLRPFCRMVVQGVDSSPFVDLDSWLLVLRRWLELDDTLQAERLQLTLGVGNQETEPRLLMLMHGQKDKYEKWLFRVLVVLSELMADNPTIGTHMSKLHSHDMLPWADWITKHLSDTYDSLRGAGTPRVKETDLVLIKENLRVYETTYFGRTAEARLREMAIRAKLGPAEGEPGTSRIESSTSNGVQVEMLDSADAMPISADVMSISADAGFGGASAWRRSPYRRFWRVTNHRMDSVNFTFTASPTPSRSDTLYPRRPNYHIPPAKRDVKLHLKPGDTQIILEVDKIDLAREFGPLPFNWVFEAAPTEIVAAPASTASDLLEQHAQLEGDLGEAARVALAAERQEAAEAEAAAMAAAKRAEEDEMSEAVAATAASLPVIPFEVVSKIQADGASVVSEKKVGEVSIGGGDDEDRVRQQQQQQQSLRRKEEEDAPFWDFGDGGAREEEKVPQETDDEDGVTVLFAHEDSTSADEGALGNDRASGDGEEAGQARDEDEHRVRV